MLPVPTMQTPIFDIPHLLRIPTPEHLLHEASIVRRSVARGWACELVPVIGKDLFEDVPVLRGRCQHEGAPSWGRGRCAVPLFYHISPARSTFSSTYAGACSPTTLALEPRGLQGH